MIYKLKYGLYKLLGMRINCVGERNWQGFKWSPKDTASYQMKK